MANQVLIRTRKNTAEFFADHYGWEMFEYKDDQYMARFTKDDFLINIYYSKMTVAVCYAGKQKFHYKVTDITLEKILINPKEYK